MNYKDIINIPTQSTMFDPKIKFRYDPIPKTGIFNRNSPRKIFRCMQTTYERRWYFAYPEMVRSSRKANVLPTNYDDKHIIDNNQRGWKRTKKRKQWMDKTNTYYKRKFMKQLEHHEGETNV